MRLWLIRPKENCPVHKQKLLSSYVFFMHIFVSVHLKLAWRVEFSFYLTISSSYDYIFLFIISVCISFFFFLLYIFSSYFMYFEQTFELCSSYDTVNSAFSSFHSTKIPAFQPGFQKYNPFSFVILGSTWDK